MAIAKPVCADARNAFGKPDAGNSHVRFEEGEGLTKTVLLYSTGLALNSFRISCNRLVFCFVKEDYLHGFEGDVGLAILIKISCNDGVMTSKCDTRRWDARVCMMN